MFIPKAIKTYIFKALRNNVMVSVYSPPVRSRSGKTKDYKIGISATLISTQHYGVRPNTDWLGIRIMCPSGATCLPKDCCFGELVL